MIRIAIIEDDNLTNKEIQSYIEKFFNEKQKELVREFAKECGQEVHQRQKTLSDKIDNFFKNLKKK